MRGKKENTIIVIENGQLKTYSLDNRLVWQIGRVTKDNDPDIKLHLATVSRKHGRLQNIDGTWFYMDHKGKNGTIYNGKQIKQGIKGRVKPVTLQNGDVLIFGGGEEAIISYKTVWSLFITSTIDDAWRVEDTKGISKLVFTDGEDTTMMECPPKGTVIEKENGMAIYMGDVTYLLGNLAVLGK